MPQITAVDFQQHTKESVGRLATYGELLYRAGDKWLTSAAHFRSSGVGPADKTITDVLF
jgi:hypothetical protein